MFAESTPIRDLLSDLVTEADAATAGYQKMNGMALCRIFQIVLPVVSVGSAILPHINLFLKLLMI